MERVTTWRASEGARWLGWTVLYGLTCIGAIFVADGSEPWPYLVGPPLAVLIGVRFHSWWRMLGPPIALSLPLSVFLIASGWVLLIPIFVVYAAVFGLSRA